MTGLGTPALAFGLLSVTLAALIFHRVLGKLVKLAGRILAALGSLALLKLVGGAVGLGLGVNLLNALVVALLGVPGLGLLMMLHWVAQI